MRVERDAQSEPRSAPLLEPEGAWTAHQDHGPLRQVCGCVHQEVRAVWLKGTVNFALVCFSHRLCFPISLFVCSFVIRCSLLRNTCSPRSAYEFREICSISFCFLLFYIQEDCDGFLYKEYLEKYRKTAFLVDCDKETYTDLIQNKVTPVVPVAGEFPVIETTNSSEYGSRLTAQSTEAFSTMSEAEYSKWWGVNLNAVTKQPSEVDTSLVCASSGIWNYGNLLSLISNNFQQYPRIASFRCMDWLCFYMEAILQCVFPVLELRVFGFPKDTCESTILKIFRLFAPIYTVEKKEDYALLYVSPEAGKNRSLCLIDRSLFIDHGTPCPRCKQLPDLFFIFFCLKQAHKPK